MNPNANIPNPGVGRRAQTLLTLHTTLDQARALAKSYVDNGYPDADSPTDFIIQYILAKLPSGNQNCTQFLADLYAGVGALLDRITAPPAPRDPAQAEIFAPQQENPFAPSATTPHETEAPKQQPLERFVCGIIECYPSNEKRTTFPSNSEFRRLSQANRPSSLSKDNHHDLLTFDALSSPLSQYTIYSVDTNTWTLAPLDRTSLIPNDYLVVLIPNNITDEDRDRIDEITALQEFWKARNDISYKFIRLPSLPPPSRKRSRSIDSSYDDADDSDSDNNKRQKQTFKGTPFVAGVLRVFPHDLNPDSIHHAPFLPPALRAPAGPQRRPLVRSHAFYGFSHPEIFSASFSEHQNAHMLYTFDPLPAPISQYDIYDVHLGLFTLEPLNRYPLVANRGDQVVVLVDRRVPEQERDRRGELRAADDVWKEWDGRKGGDKFVEMRLPKLPDDPVLANKEGQTVFFGPKEEEGEGEKEGDGNAVAVAGPSKPRERKTRVRKNPNPKQAVVKDDADASAPSPVGKGKKRAREDAIDEDSKGKKRALDSDDEEEAVQPQQSSPPKKARKGRKKPVPVPVQPVQEEEQPKRRSTRIAKKK